MIHAIIRPEVFGKVKDGLESKGFIGLTIHEVRGRGRQGGVTWKTRGDEYKVELLPKVKLELVVRDEDVGEAIKVIAEAAYTGQIGDGKIFVTSVEDALRIRTGERGQDAIDDQLSEP